MTSNEVARLRRQMQRRIREVVAERRIARQESAIRAENGEGTTLSVESAS